MNRKQMWIIVAGIVLAALVLFLPGHARLDLNRGETMYFFDLKVSPLAQALLLLVVAAITTVMVWGNRSRA